MSVNLDDCTLSGGALTFPFLRDGLVVRDDAADGWRIVRGSACRGGVERVHRNVTAKLATALGYQRLTRQGPVTTREGPEAGGWMLQAPVARLRAWTVGSEDHLDSAERKGPTRSAQRVLFAANERAGLLTDGATVRLLLCDPIRADSYLAIPIDRWPILDSVPDSYRVLATLAAARNLTALPSILDAARLHQARVGSTLRRQARDAITGFVNALPDLEGADAAVLWRECLILVYRLLFILKLESPVEAGAGFSFATTRLWRESLSPNQALGALVRRHLDLGHDTGTVLESGLRSLFTIFRDGLSCSELCIVPLAGGLFGAGSTPLLDRLRWSDRAVALMLDKLIWTGTKVRERTHYGSLGVEDLGSIYEGLLELEPAIATRPTPVLRRGKRGASDHYDEIQSGTFYLRAGSGRKSTGSFYTPHEFVRFLVRETLNPKIAALSPGYDPQPAALLTLKIVDPATGSGHFLVEACRYLGDALLAACQRADESGLHDRIAALPDPENTLASYLPSRGFVESRARAICRRLVAVNCLYGCDRNELAIELAKLSLWLESWAEGLPLTFLDHRLVRGDALTGPFFPSLATLPVTGAPLDPLLASGVASRLEGRLAQGRDLVARLNASIGQDIADAQAKQAVKDRLDKVLGPLRRLAQAWTQAAMGRNRNDDDVWLDQARHVVETGEWPGSPPDHEALPWDLIFPEVFPRGFAIVLGNPPWDVLSPNMKEFVAGYEPAVLDSDTTWKRRALRRAVLSRKDVAAAHEAYRRGFASMKNLARRLYPRQPGTRGSLDLFRLFAERNLTLVAEDGAIGMLLPSAFHANDGTTDLRRQYLDKTDMTWYLSFENRRRVFDIDSRFKFTAIVAHKPGPTRAMRCGFYLERIEDASDAAKIMTYSRTFIASSGMLELRGAVDLHVAERLFAQQQRFGEWCKRHRIHFGCDLHMTADAGIFLPDSEGPLPVFEGKTFHQYTGIRIPKPRYSVTTDSLKPLVLEASGHRRLAFRDIARATDERTAIAFIAPKGVVFGHTATVEKMPSGRQYDDALVLCAVFNSFTFDWLVRRKAATHLSLYLLAALPMPELSDAERAFLARSVEVLSNRSHLDLRARVDAVVARAYGLDLDGYRHVLKGFSHKSDPGAPARCLRAYSSEEPLIITA